MKLTLQDCYTLLRERIDAVGNLSSMFDTVEFWESLSELTTEGLNRAKERQELVDKQLPPKFRK